MSLRSISAFAQTCKVNHHSVTSFFKHQIHCLLAHTFFDPQGFLWILEATQGTVLGSSVLHIIFSMCNNAWQAKDVDMYVPLGRCQPIFNYLKHKGFVHTSSYSPHPYSGSLIQSISTMEQDASKVDVIESQHDTALSPIFDFHLMAVMNYITADSVFAAYLSFTNDHQAIINPELFVEGSLNPATLCALVKYEQRGFTINPGCVNLLWKQRLTKDRECFKMMLNPLEERSMEATRMAEFSWILERG
ncbi:hypothetical protein JVU11DRAFT_7665 [Chiua virens]|nr:hypothetical protein JVU11DRAFT_7665 [Chiua virens]